MSNKPNRILCKFCGSNVTVDQTNCPNCGAILPEIREDALYDLEESLDLGSSFNEELYTRFYEMCVELGICLGSMYSDKPSATSYDTVTIHKWARASLYATVCIERKNVSTKALSNLYEASDDLFAELKKYPGYYALDCMSAWPRMFDLNPVACGFVLAADGVPGKIKVGPYFQYYHWTPFTYLSDTLHLLQLYAAPEDSIYTEQYDCDFIKIAPARYCKEKADSLFNLSVASNWDTNYKEFIKVLHNPKIMRKMFNAEYCYYIIQSDMNDVKVSTNTARELFQIITHIVNYCMDIMYSVTGVESDIDPTDLGKAKDWLYKNLGTDDLFSKLGVKQ